MDIPVLSSIPEGLKSFFKTRRYVAYLIIFVFTTFLALFVSWLMTLYVGQGVETILVTFFTYVGATGTFYFMIGTILTSLGLDKLWIKRRGRGQWNELIGATWLAVSFAIAVFMSLAYGLAPLVFFAAICWIGWIAFQAFLSSRTSLRIATIAEPKKGGLAIGIGSFIVLIIGLGIIAAEALLALVLIPGNMFGIGDMIVSIFPEAQANLTSNMTYLYIAYAIFGLYGLLTLISFMRYGKKGAALNIALLTLFIAIYSGWFLVNVMRRTTASAFDPVDITLTLFFLVYAMSGIGRTVIETVEESRSRLRDLGPLFTFFLASGFVYVDSIIAASTAGGQIATMLQLLYFQNEFAAFVFRDVAKLIAFPLVTTFTMLYYLRVERVERIVGRAREEGVTFELDEVDEEIAERAPEPGKPWPSERAEGIPEGKPGHELSRRDERRLTIDKSRRLGKPKRVGEEEEEEED